MEETSTDKNQRGYELYNEIIECWKYAWYDKETDTNYYRPTSYKQVQKAVENIKKIDELNIDDPELIELTESIRTVTENSTKRKFIGGKWIVILSGLGASFLVFLMLTAFIANFKGYAPEKATELHGNAIEQSEKYLAKYTLDETGAIPQGFTGTEKERKKQEKVYKKELDKLKGMTPEKYLKKENSKLKWEGTKNLFSAIFWILLYSSYFYAARAPIYLINRREKELEIKRKSAKSISTFIFVTFASIMSAPTTVTVTKWSDGSTTRDDNALAQIVGRIAFILIIGFVIILMAAQLLPVLVIFNYLRNYQFEKVDKVIYWIKTKLKLKRKDESDDCGNATV